MFSRVDWLGVGLEVVRWILGRHFLDVMIDMNDGLRNENDLNSSMNSSGVEIAWHFKLRPNDYISHLTLFQVISFRCVGDLLNANMRILMIY
jgi:hypothetical protein